MWASGVLKIRLREWRPLIPNCNEDPVHRDARGYTYKIVDKYTGTTNWSVNLPYQT